LRVSFIDNTVPSSKHVRIPKYRKSWPAPLRNGLSPLSPVNLLIIGLTGSAEAGLQTLANESFESGTTPQWRRITSNASSAYVVSKYNISFAGSNFDGVSGDYFMPTVKGREYRLTYNCGATDSWSVPQQSQSMTFRSLVRAYHGMKTIIDHTGQPREVEDLELLKSNTNSFTTPGASSWKIHGWTSVELIFKATGYETWVDFSTPTTTGMSTVGVLDTVTVTAKPFVFISNTTSGPTLEYSGEL
jgi:hypothetical protein